LENPLQISLGCGKNLTQLSAPFRRHFDGHWPHLFKVNYHPYPCGLTSNGCYVRSLCNSPVLKKPLSSPATVLYSPTLNACQASYFVVALIWWRAFDITFQDAGMRRLLADMEGKDGDSRGNVVGKAGCHCHRGDLSGQPATGATAETTGAFKAAIRGHSSLGMGGLSLTWGCTASPYEG